MTLKPKNATIKSSKTVNGVTTTYYLNGSQILGEETNGNVTLYVYDASGSPIGMQYHGANYADGVWDVYWYEKNLQGDIVGVYNQAGMQLASYKYNAWGTVYETYLNGGADTSAAKNPFLYRGYYYDRELDMYYLGARYYDPATCRFISPDSINLLLTNPTLLTDKNLYAYCDNNPVTRVDDGGEYWHILAGAAIGFTFELGAQLIAKRGDFSEVNWLSVGIATVVGGITATCGPAVGAIISGVGNAAIDIVTQAETGNVDLSRVGISFVVGAGSSLIGYGIGKVAGKVGSSIKIHNLSKQSPGVIKKTVLKTIEVAGKDRNAIKNLSWAVSQKSYSNLPNALLGKTIPQIFDSSFSGAIGYGVMGGIYGF